MKALSLKQPWANMIVSGEKTIETRKWRTFYRGDILICSSKIPKIEPAGFALAIVNLYNCRPMCQRDVERACCDVYPRAWAWLLRDIRPIEPFPVKGSLGIFDLKVPPEMIHFYESNTSRNTSSKVRKGKEGEGKEGKGVGGDILYLEWELKIP